MQCGTDSPLYTWLFPTLHSARTQQNDWVESLRCINLAQTSTHVYYLCSQSKAWAAKLPLRLLLQPCAKVSLLSVLVLFFFMRWVQCIYGSNLGFRLCFFRWSCVRRFYSLVLLRWDPWVFVPSSPPPPEFFITVSRQAWDCLSRHWERILPQTYRSFQFSAFSSDSVTHANLEAPRESFSLVLGGFRTFWKVFRAWTLSAVVRLPLLPYGFDSILKQVVEFDWRMQPIITLKHN